jgi:hypothetical protein
MPNKFQIAKFQKPIKSDSGFRLNFEF